MTISKIAAVVASAVLFSIGALAQTTPQGRLTLTSNTPVMTSDVVGATTVYYTPYVGTYIPLYNGSSWVNTQFSQLTLTLSCGNMSSNALYDVYVFLNSSTVTIGVAVDGWSSLTARNEIPEFNSSWPVLADNNLNNNLLNGSTVYSRTSGTGTQIVTYVGTIYVNSSCETTVNFKPSAAAGGSDNVVGIWNAYNRVRILSMETDSNTAWTYATDTWRPLDGGSGNTKNRVTFLDGLGQSFVKARAATIAYSSTAGANCMIGISENSTTGSGKTASYLQSSPGGSAAGAVTFSDEDSFPPLLGLNYIQAMEISPNAVTDTFAFNGDETGLLYEGEY
jgi:hypothetical protein